MSDPTVAEGEETLIVYEEPTPEGKDTLPEIREEAAAPKQDDAEGLVEYTNDDTKPTIPSAYGNGDVNLFGDELGSYVVRYNQEVQNRGERAFVELAMDANSYANALFHAAVEPSEEAERAFRALNRIPDKSKVLAIYVDPETKRPLLGVGKIPKPSAAVNQFPQGDDAERQMWIMDGANRRIPLFNSGIFIDIRALTNVNIAVLLEKISTSTAIYGREFGAHYYSYADTHTKAMIADILFRAIIGSNMHNYRKVGALLNTIKLPDLDVILMGFASIMFPKGYDRFVHVCANPKCNHREQRTIDPARMILNNFGAIPEDCVKFMVKNSGGQNSVPRGDIFEYHKQLGLEGDHVVREFENYTFTMRIPTVADYLQAGNKFIENLMMDISVASDGAYRALAHMRGRMFVPWIKKMTQKVGDQLTTIEDPNIIATQIDHLMGKSSGRIAEIFEEYIDLAKLSHIGHAAFACPACGETPKTNTGFVTVDPVSTFFTMCLHRSTRE